MLAHTKKHHTEDAVELRFIGPVKNRAKAADTLAALGFYDASESVPWRGAFPETAKEQLPGKCLAGLRYREGITQKQLANKTGIMQAHISAMENGKRPIGKKTAKIFGEVFKISWKVFL